MTDIDAMATYLPYCDVYGADRFMAEVAKSLKVPERYGCRLFDSGKDGVANLIDHLRNAVADHVGAALGTSLALFNVAPLCVLSFI